MSTKRSAINRLEKIRAVLLSAVSELDVRGNDVQITKAMCVIEATLDAAISGKAISTAKAFKYGLAMSIESESK